MKAFFQNTVVMAVVLFLLTSCVQFVPHTDPFYDFNENDFPRDHLPLFKPIEATRESPTAPWHLEMANAIWIDLPNSNEVYAYYNIEELEKISVVNGIIMAYSSFENQNADEYILNNYYHWFVMIPNDDITEGFHTEDDFLQFVQIYGILSPDWITPDEAFAEYAKTGGCLEWIPDCD